MIPTVKKVGKWEVRRKKILKVRTVFPWAARVQQCYTRELLEAGYIITQRTHSWRSMLGFLSPKCPFILGWMLHPKILTLKPILLILNTSWVCSSIGKKNREIFRQRTTGIHSKQPTAYSRECRGNMDGAQCSNETKAVAHSKCRNINFSCMELNAYTK